MQGLVPTNAWQAARSADGEHGYTLVSCVVVPGFEFAGFELAPPGWNPCS
ncbi:MAG: cupin domain-containing protein [Pseudomonadota bacterium]